MTKAPTILEEVVIPEVGTLIYVEAAFDQAQEIIRASNGTLASARDVARARMQEGEKERVSLYGSLVKESLVYIPNQSPLLIREPPIVNPVWARNATQAHRENREFYLEETVAQGYAEQAEEDRFKPLYERRVLRMPTNEDYRIQTYSFDKEKAAKFLFGPYAKSYGNFLRSLDIKSVPVRLVNKDAVNSSARPFLRGLNFERVIFPWEPSELRGSLRTLHYEWGVRGIRPNKT